MNSFEPGQIIQNISKLYAVPFTAVVVVSVKPVEPPCGSSAIITVLPLGENKLLGPIFAVTSHWDLVFKDPR